ncbi:hypothetical protein K4H01_26550, partial [Mycobacterium tuberculosis]|nr:hypothetical protein [Mycobacterium tuberculosis]
VHTGVDDDKDVEQCLVVQCRGAKRGRQVEMTRIRGGKYAVKQGALLLEARLIKEQQPLFNKRLRRNKQLCAWLLADDR